MSCRSVFGLLLDDWFQCTEVRVWSCAVPLPPLVSDQAAHSICRTQEDDEVEDDAEGGAQSPFPLLSPEPSPEKGSEKAAEGESPRRRRAKKKAKGLKGLCGGLGDCGDVDSADKEAPTAAAAVMARHRSYQRLLATYGDGDGGAE